MMGGDEFFEEPQMLLGGALSHNDYLRRIKKSEAGYLGWQRLRWLQHHVGERNKSGNHHETLACKSFNVSALIGAKPFL